MPFGLLEWRKISAVQMSAAIRTRILHESGSVWCLHWRWSSRLPFGKNSYTNTLASLHTPMRVTSCWSSSSRELVWRSLFSSSALCSFAFCSSLYIWRCSFSRLAFSLEINQDVWKTKRYSTDGYCSRAATVHAVLFTRPLHHLAPFSITGYLVEMTTCRFWSVYDGTYDPFV